MKVIQNKSTYIAFALHALIWSTILLLPYLVSTASNDYKIGPIPGFLFTIMGTIHMGIFYTNACYLYPKLLNRRFWWLYFISVALLLLVSFQLKYMVMAAWFPEMLQDSASYKFVYGSSTGIFIISIVYRKVIDAIRREKEQKEKRTQQLFTELKFLRSQISPHFLFNVLTNLVSLARKKSDQLEPSLIMLSGLMRYMLYDAQDKKVALEKEIGYLNSYIELQKLRFGNDVQINSQISLPPQDGAYMIEPMLLIPFVENAFKHGVGYIQDPQINIKLSLIQGVMTFEVWNKFDREQDTSKDESSGIGLPNVQYRLNLLYRDKHHLVIHDDNNCFHVTLTLELI